MKQTPIEWFVDQLHKKWTYIPKDWWKEIDDIIAQAKKMEKLDENKLTRQISELERKLNKFTYTED